MGIVEQTSTIFFVLISIYHCIHCADLRCYKGSLESYSVYSLQDPESLLRSTCFTSGRKTVIYAFGFGGKPSFSDTAAVVGTYVARNTTNTILLNWEQEASNGNGGVGNLLYPLAITRGKLVAKQFGETLLKLNKAGLDLNEVHLIGHSLGAQLMGAAGRLVKDRGLSVGRITGLDPAGPLFDGIISLPSLTAESASIVDVFHTNPGALGTKENQGTVDVWPNCGGVLQPGCETPVVIASSCSHGLAWLYYAEAVEQPNTFLAISATSCNEWKSGNVGNRTIALGDNTDVNARGTFFLSTNLVPPYGKGTAGLRPS